MRRKLFTNIPKQCTVDSTEETKKIVAETYLKHEKEKLMDEIIEMIFLNC